MLLQNEKLCSFLWLRNISLCVCECVCVYTHHIFFIHSSVHGHLGCFHVLALVNSAAMNVEVHISFQIRVFSRYMSNNGIARSHGSSILSFLRNLHTVFYSGCTSIHSHQQYEGSFFSTPSPAFVTWRLFDDSHADRCEVIVVLICISLIIGSVEYLFMCFLAVLCLL